MQLSRRKRLFSVENSKYQSPCLIFNHTAVNLAESKKHPGIVLDSRLDLKEHLEIIFKKSSKTKGLLRKLLSPRKSLITVYKSLTIYHITYQQ